MLLTLGMLAQPDHHQNTLVDGQKHGQWVAHFEGSSKVRYVGEFDHGRPIKITHYHTNGQIRAVMVFDDQGVTCLVTEWHSNGKLSAEGSYAGRGIRHGIWKIYDKQGLLISKEEYVDGVQQGTQIFYYAGGQQVLEKGHMEQGEKHGTWYRYLEDGTKSKIENFQHGQYHGEWSMYDINGRLMVKGFFQHDLREGTWRFFEDGEVTRVEYYRRGRQIEKKVD